MQPTHGRIAPREHVASADQGCRKPLPWSGPWSWELPPARSLGKLAKDWLGALLAARATPKPDAGQAQTQQRQRSGFGHGGDDQEF